MSRRTFLSWTQPLLPAAADHLCAGWRGGALDLSDCVAVVPTAGAGRRLREALAQRAAARGTAVLSPHFITPEVITEWTLREQPAAATDAEVLMVWMQVLTALPPDALPALFPVPPVSRDAAWARSTAAEFIRLRRQLEEGGRTIAAGAAVFGPGHPDAARWQDLAELESMFLTALRRHGLTDPVSARIAAASDPVFPPEITRILVLAVPDPPQLLLTALERAERRGLEVEVCIHADPALADAFDAAGRPLPDVWSARIIDIPHPREQIRLLPRPADAAELLAGKLAGPGDPDTLVIGSADPEVMTPLRDLAAKAGTAVFDPNGQALRSHQLTWTLSVLADLLRSDSAQAAGRLLRQPAVLHAAGIFSPESLLREWDEFCQAHLPRTLADAAVLAARWKPRRKNFPADWKPALRLALQWLSDECGALRQGDSAAALQSFIDRFCAGLTFATAEEQSLFADALELWQATLESLDSAAARTGSEFDTATLLDTALHLLRDGRLYPDNSEDAPVLHGWLELPWQDAPHLVVAGINEGMAPDSIVGDPWLPDSIRTRLDLKSNAVRLARDSCLLTAMIECRRAGGSVLLLASRESAQGDPLKPGRLLLRCPEEELPERALRLFPKESMESDRPPPPTWHRAWKLRVPAPDRDADIFRRMSVTQFVDYLSCPFRFYLKHVLRMEPFDAARDEMDARGFGSLIHDSIERLHASAELRDSADEAAIADFLDDAIRTLTTGTYGEDPGLPVIIQLESARSRLRAFAGIQAAERAAGWRIEHVEQSFPEALNGVEISGRIDLIEYHAETGVRRVIDYKTAAKAADPVKAHLKALRGEAGSGLPAWRLVPLGDRPHAWINLQLPFYAWIVSRLGHDGVQAGYINLPAASSEAAIRIWPDLDRSLIDSAVACARGVIRSISDGIFWPPARPVEYDDFKGLWFRDAAESFDASLIEKFRELRASEKRPAS